MKQTVIIDLTSADIEKILRDHLFEATGQTLANDKADFRFEGHALSSGRGVITSLNCKITFTQAEAKKGKATKRAPQKW